MSLSAERTSNGARTALWQPDIQPPNNWLIPAVLYQDKISTVSPAVISRGSPASRRLPMRVQRALDSAEQLQDTLGDLYTPARLDFFPAIQLDAIALVAKRFSTSAASGRYQDWALAPRGRGSRRALTDDKRTSLEAKRSQLSGEIDDVRSALLSAENQIAADLQPNAVELERLDAEAATLGLELRELKELTASQGAVSPDVDIDLLISEARAELKQIKLQLARPTTRTPELEERQRSMKVTLTRLNAGLSPVIDEQGRAALEEIEKVTAHLRAVRSQLDLKRAAQNRAQSLLHSEPRYLDLKRRLDALEARQRSIESQLRPPEIRESPVAKGLLQEMHRGQLRDGWDYLLGSKVSHEVAEMLVSDAGFVRAPLTGWSDIFFAPTPLMRRVVEELAITVCEERGWIPMGRTGDGAIGSVGDSDRREPPDVRSAVTAFLTRLPYPSGSVPLADVVSFRRKNEEAFRATRSALEDLAAVAAQVADNIDDQIHAINRRLNEALDDVSTALMRQSERSLTTVWQIVRSPAAIGPPGLGYLGGLAQQAVTDGLADHLSPASLVENLYSKEALVGLAVGIAGSVVVTEVRALRAHRAVRRAGLAYLYDVSRTLR